MSEALYRKHRPTTFKNVEGNGAAVSSIKSMLKKGFPQVTLLHGPSGTGKTTLARIITDKLDVDERDVTEINASNNRGIDFFRDVVRGMKVRPLIGKAKVYILDECHMLTKVAQDCLLQPLEDTPALVYIFLCTTEPNKLVKAIQTRCTKVECTPLCDEDIIDVLKRIVKLEKAEVPKKVLGKIADNSDGSSRQAINTLEALIGLKPKEMMKIAETSFGTPTEVIELCRLMMGHNSKDWKKVAAILKGLETDPESTRRQVLGYANACMLRGDNMKAYCILDAFREPFFNTGKPGLTLACYEALNMDED